MNRRGIIGVIGFWGAVGGGTALFTIWPVGVILGLAALGMGLASYAIYEAASDRV